MSLQEINRQMVDLFFFSDRPLGRMFDTVQSALDSGLKVLLLELDLVHHMLHVGESLPVAGLVGCECLRACYQRFALCSVPHLGFPLNSPVLPLDSSWPCALTLRARCLLLSSPAPPLAGEGRNLVR